MRPFSTYVQPRNNRAPHYVQFIFIFKTSTKSQTYSVSIRSCLAYLPPYGHFKIDTRFNIGKNKRRRIMSIRLLVFRLIQNNLPSCPNSPFSSVITLSLLHGAFLSSGHGSSSLIGHGRLNFNIPSIRLCQLT